MLRLIGILIASIIALVGIGICIYFVTIPVCNYADVIYRTILRSEFIIREGSYLYYNGNRWRFSGANLYWLGLDENDPPDTVAYPTQWRINNGLNAVVAMNGEVVRSHTLGISVGCELCIEPELGIFNETALEHIDYVVAVASNYSLKLVIPLTDNYDYYHGGKITFTRWRNVSVTDFYTNDLVISDFKEYITMIIGRTNTLTGVRYCDDPTILAWETGNELSDVPSEWTAMISGYIKTLDPNHLIIDGSVNNFHDTTNIDMFTAHYYPRSIVGLEDDLCRVSRYNKPFYIGEYDWTNDTNVNLADWLETVNKYQSICGDTFWSLFPHLDPPSMDYEQHNDGYTLHYPGDTDYMQQAVNIMTNLSLGLLKLI